VEIRVEKPGDESAIHDVHASAFADPEHPESTPFEAKLVDDLRIGSAWLPDLSVVALVEGAIVGHVVCTRGHVDGEPVLALGPIGVLPLLQRQNIGTDLMREVVGRVDSLGETLIGLVGEIAFYSRFGFVTASTLSIESPLPDWGDYFQVRPLTGYRPSIIGEFEYPAEFGIT